ncbi:MAG: M15 family metallopeptidase [Magnetococcus sp. DMHC-1]
MMKRRQFLTSMAVGAAGLGLGLTPQAMAATGEFESTGIPTNDPELELALLRTRHFNEHLPGDAYLDPAQFKILESTVRRLERLQQVVGYGNFYLLDFDEAIKTANDSPRVGQFPRSELDFMDMIFHETAVTYGFMGKKPLKNLTDRTPRRKVVKVPFTGNFLFKGHAVEVYRRIRRDIGNQVVLTSGVRSVPKQFLLFLTKAYEASGNLSLASRSLAPPGYSFHGVGDFDVGQVGFGEANFTARFVESDVFKKLRECGYTQMRYPQDNLLGVRFEPWHIKVVT